MYREILVQILSQEEMQVTFPGLPSLASLVETECYGALLKIRDIIKDDRSTDETCFEKIEEIISTLEFLGIDTGPRHDFG